MFSSRRFLVWLVPVSILGYLLWLYVFLGQGEVFSGGAGKPSFQLSMVEVAEVKGEEKLWQLRAVEAAVDEKSQVTFLREAEGTFFRQGKALLEVKAPAVQIDYKSGEIVLEKAKATYHYGPPWFDLSLRAGQLDWQTQEGRLRGREGAQPQGVSLSGKNLRLAGEELLAFPGEGKLRLEGKVKAVLSSLGERSLGELVLRGAYLSLGQEQKEIKIGPCLQADYQDFHIRGAAACYNWQEALLRLEGPATLSWEEGEVCCGQLLFYQDEERIDFLGGVRVDFAGLEGTSQKGEYLLSENKIILTGAPRLSGKRWDLGGERIVFSLDEEKAYVQGQGQITVEGEK